MKKLAKMISTALLASALAMPASASSIRYELDLDAGDATATGFFETDGTIGAISLSNITSFEISISDNGVNLGSFTSAPNAFITSNIVTATATDLFFNFDSSATSAQFRLQAGRSDGYLIFCMEAISAAGCSGAGDQTFSLGKPTGPNLVRNNVSSFTGNVAFASVAAAPDSTPAVPLPASMPLLLGAFGAIAAVKRKRRKKATA